MAWTAPKTWTTGDLVTAALANAQWRDNFLETAPAKVTTAGDLVHATAANALARLAIGVAAQVLRVNAAATAPAWETPTAAATVDALVRRDADGRAKVVAPSVAGDVAILSTVTDHAALTAAGTHGSTAAATADKLVHRDAAGRAAFAAPAAAGDVAIKATVDAVMSRFIMEY